MDGFNFILSATNWRYLHEKIDQLDRGIKWAVKIQPYKSKRTIDQNARLWKLYTALGNHIGLESEEVHQLMGYKFLRYQKAVNGKIEEFIKSTTKLNTKEMGEYQDGIERWAAEIGFYFDYIGD